MRKRERLVPLGVLLGMMLVLLIACSRFTNVPGAPSPTAPPATTPMSDRNYWESWARAADVAGVLSLAVGVVTLIVAVVAGLIAWLQLRHQLAAIAEGLSRPLLVYGFESDRDERTRHARVWGDRTSIVALHDPENVDSRPTNLRIIFGNVGGKAAVNILQNLDFPAGLQIVDREARGRQYASDSGYQRITPSLSILNPHDVGVMDLTLVIPLSMNAFEITAVASCSDSIENMSRLFVDVEHRTATYE